MSFSSGRCELDFQQHFLFIYPCLSGARYESHAFIICSFCEMVRTGIEIQWLDLVQCVFSRVSNSSVSFFRIGPSSPSIFTLANCCCTDSMAKWRITDQEISNQMGPTATTTHKVVFEMLGEHFQASIRKLSGDSIRRGRIDSKDEREYAVMNV